jgi:autophagy-related protein 9
VLNEPDGLRDDYYGLKDDKMAASVQNFMQYYSHFNQRQNQWRTGGWQAPPPWPAMLAQDTIAEEGGTTTQTAQPSSNVRPASTRKSGILDRRRQRSPLSVRSPPQVARAVSGRDRKPKTETSIDLGEAKSGGAAHGVSESRLMSQDSDLHDFDLSAGGDPLESDTDENDLANGNGGVLGMLQQFAKAHTEKGTGVNI